MWIIDILKNDNLKYYKSGYLPLSELFNKIVAYTEIKTDYFCFILLVETFEIIL